MLWVILAIIGASANAAFYIVVKKYVHSLDPRLLTAIGFILGTGILLSVSAVQGFPPIGPEYWTAVIVSAALNVIGLTLIYAALSSSDLSLSMPMLSFTPAFLIVTSFILLGEVPSLFGIAGIMIIVSGSYVLNISSEHENFLDPIRSMVKSRASWYMLIVAFLFAASINYDKIGMLNSDPVFGMTFTLLFIGISFAIIWAAVTISAKDQSPVHGIAMKMTLSDRFKPYIVPSIIVAFFASVECVSINIAYTLQIVPYVIALKRLAIIIMVLYGTIVCRESGLVARFIGATMMVGGAVVIILFA